MLVPKTCMPSAALAHSVARQALARAVKGVVVISHHSLAVCGSVLVAALVVLASRADVRQDMEGWALDWLLTRQESRVVTPEVEALDDSTEPSLTTAQGLPKAPVQLDRQQTAVAQWIAKRYHVAPQPIGSLVQEAWALGRKAGLEPTLILAIMAVESSFNPYAQSPVGAQGLMQVMTTVHDDKYRPFGGIHAAFDPLSNLRVGVTVLKECVLRAGGSLEGGLRMYVGAANLEDDGGYAAKVMAEQDFLRQVALGRPVPANARWTPPAPTPMPAPDLRPAAVTEAASVPHSPPAARAPQSDEAERVALLQ
jgi:hypothetical protein